MGPHARPKCRWEKDPKTGSQTNITPIIVLWPSTAGCLQERLV